MAQTYREQLVAELEAVRAAILNITKSQVEQYGVAGGKTFQHLKLKDLQARETTLMIRLAAIDSGGAPMTTIVPLRTRRGQ